MPQNVDLAKRRRIMQRSQRLGHCICDPRRPCPCDIFTSQGICPCAGERPHSTPAEDVRLTELVHNAGCASKIAPAELETVLARLPQARDEAVLIGMAHGDDAGVYRLPDGTCLVQTVDVMTPCVDDAHTFGRICAANCLSDIYAMGGQPTTALSILAFPSETLSGQIMYEMMAGIAEALGEAGVPLIGGHSIKDEEIKLGLAVTGLIDEARAVSHESARPGDLLVLTKPLGGGVLNFARQVGRSYGPMEPVEQAMATLNAPAAAAMGEVGVSAATDVTGFGLFGHLISLCRHSGVTAQIWADALPAFDGALEALAEDVVPGAVERNSEYVADDIRLAGGVDEARVHLGFDAQTSGGLLIAVPADRHPALLAALNRREVPCWTVGQIAAESSGKILVTLREQSAAEVGLPEEIVDQKPHDEPAPPATDSVTPAGDPDPEQRDGAGAPPPAASAPAETACCADVFGPSSKESAPAIAAAPLRPATGDGNDNGDADGKGETATTSPDSLRAFGALMRSTGQRGAIDERTKELINFALVLLSRCEPCLAAHLAKARKMGLTQAELDEAAWCAIAMGGAPVKMFYAEAVENQQAGQER